MENIPGKQADAHRGTPISPEQLQPSHKWVEYDSNSDYRALSRVIHRHRMSGDTNVEELEVGNQLYKGNIYVCYSQDYNGEFTNPRIAISTDGKYDRRIVGIRGLGEGFGDEYGDVSFEALPVLEEKLKEFPNGKQYEKKVRDMMLLGAILNKMWDPIQRKHLDSVELSTEELRFIYEADAPIEGFGIRPEYSPYRRVIRDRRNLADDLPAVFGFSEGSVAKSFDGINSNTKIYIGPLAPGVLELLVKYGIKHVYTQYSLENNRTHSHTFPFAEAAIGYEQLAIGGVNSKELLRRLKDLERNKEKIKTSLGAVAMIDRSDFKTLEDPKDITLITLRVGDLGLKGYSRIAQILERAKELGLSPCPAEVGPHKRLRDINPTLGQYEYIVMEPINIKGYYHYTDGDPNRTFTLEHNDQRNRYAGIYLSDSSRFSNPESTLNEQSRLVFTLTKEIGKKE